MAEQRYGVNQSAMLRIGLQIERNEAQVKRFMADIKRIEDTFGKDLPRSLKKGQDDLKKIAGKMMEDLFPDKNFKTIQQKIGALVKEFDKLKGGAKDGFATKAERDRFLALAKALDITASGYKNLSKEAVAAARTIRSNEAALFSAMSRGAAGVRASEMAYASRMSSGLISPAQLSTNDQMMVTARREMESQFRQRAAALRANEERYAQGFFEQRTGGQITRPGYLTRGQYDATHARAIQEDKQRTIRLENEHTRALDKQRTTMKGLQLQVSQIRNAWLLYNFATRIVRDSFMELLETSARWERAQMGLVAIGQKLNISTTDLNAAVKILTNDGLLSMIDASKSVNVLLSTGIGLPKTIELLMAAKDAAAFNRQGYLSMSEALYGLADGVKNFISRNVDNVGISKNLSVILREEAAIMGRKIEQMSELEKTQAVVNGLIKEAALYWGNAAKAANTLDGKLQHLDNTWTQFKVTIGDDIPFKKTITWMDLLIVKLGELYKEVAKNKLLWEPTAFLSFMVSPTRYAWQKEKMEREQAAGRPGPEPLDFYKPKGSILDQSSPAGSGFGVYGSTTEEIMREMRIRTNEDALEKAIEQEKERFRDARDKIEASKPGAGEMVRAAAELKSYEDLAIGVLIGNARSDALKNITNLGQRVSGHQLGAYGTGAKGVAAANAWADNIATDLKQLAEALPKAIQSDPQIVSAIANLKDATQGKLAEMIARSKTKMRSIPFSSRSYDFISQQHEAEQGRMGVLSGLSQYLDINTQKMIIQRQFEQAQLEIENLFVNPESSPGQISHLPRYGEATRGNIKRRDEAIRQLEGAPAWLKASVTATNDWVAGLRDVNRALTVMGDLGSKSMQKLVRNTTIAIEGLANIAGGLQSLSTASRFGGQLSGLAGSAALIGGTAGVAAGVIGLGVGIYSAFNASKQQSRNRQRGAEFGATVQRGPQVVNITPVLTVQADGNIIFSADGMEAVEADLVRRMQQAIDDGEISLASL